MSDVVKVADWNGNPLSGINIRIAVGDEPVENALDDRLTQFDGTTAFAFRPSSPDQRYTLYVNEWNSNGTHGGTHVPVQFPLPDNYTIGLKANPLPRLHMTSPFYMNVMLRGTIGFCDYLKWLREDRDTLRTIYRQCQAVKGHNARSVAFSLDNIDRLHPEVWANFYSELDEFADFAAQYGQYIFPIFIADGGNAFSGEGAARHHWNQMKAFVERWGFASKGANEGHSHTNFPWNMASFPRPHTPFAYYCHTGGSGSPAFNPKDPQGDFYCFHPTRKGNGAIKDCCVFDHPARQKDSDYNYPSGWRDKGVGVGEPDGFGVDPRPDGKNYSTSLQRAREMGGASEGTACFNFMLTPAGKLSIPFDDHTYALVRAYFQQ